MHAPARVVLVLALLAQLAVACARTPPPLHSGPVLLDTDCGYDDSTALAMLVRAHVDVVGITTVQGDADCTPGTANMGRLLAVFKQPDIPLAKGATAPSTGGHLFPWDIRKLSNTLDGVPLPPGPPAVTPVAESAAHFMVRMAEEHAGELVVLAIGPLTNVLHALELGGDTFVRNVKSLVVMGGALEIEGNAPNHKGELNIYADPAAAKRVFEFFGTKIFLSTADLSAEGVITDGMMASVCAPAPTTPAATLMCRCLAIMKTWTPAVLFDPLAAAFVLQPALAEAVPTRVHVDVSTGQTTAGGAGAPIHVLHTLNWDGLVSLLSSLTH